MASTGLSGTAFAAGCTSIPVPDVSPMRVRPRVVKRFLLLNLVSKVDFGDGFVFLERCCDLHSGREGAKREIAVDMFVCYEYCELVWFFWREYCGQFK